MKLYLGSYRISDPEGLEVLAGVPLEELDVALIPNAKDVKPELERQDSLNKLQHGLGEIGVRATEVDLREFDDASEVARDLGRFSMLFVAGGNSFVLRERMRESGFEDSIHDLLSTGVIYLGESAGSVVAGGLMASADVEDRSKVQNPIVEGLGLVDRVVIPHANWSWRQGYVEKMEELHGDRLLLLNDTDAFMSASSHD